MDRELIEGMDRERTAVIFLLIVVVLGGAYSYLTIQQKSEQVRDLSAELRNTRQVLNTTQQALRSANSEINRLETQLNEKENTIEEMRRRLGLAQREISELQPTIKSYSVVAVGSDGEGVVIPLEVKIAKGSGSISVNIRNVDLEPGVQESVRTAVSVAFQRTGRPLSSKDVTVSFVNRRDEVVRIDGGSAGAAISVTTVAAIRNDTMDDDVLVTGTISTTGDIGRVGEVREKAEAAEAHGAREFLVPDGQHVNVEGIRVREVDDIRDVIRHVIR